MTDEAQTISQAVNNAPQSEENNISYLDTLVGEGKKYSDPELLAKSYVNADNHIKILEEEQRELRAQNKALETVLSRLRSEDFEEEEAQAPTTNVAAAIPTMDKTDVESTVQEVLKRERELERRRNTQNESFSLLDKEYGGREAGLSAVADILKVRPSLQSTIDELGQTDSDAFIKLIRSYKEPPNAMSNTPGVNDKPSASAVRGSDANFLPWSEAQRIRKEEPNVYKSEEFRRKMEASHIRAEREGRDYFAT